MTHFYAEFPRQAQFRWERIHLQLIYKNVSQFSVKAVSPLYL